MHCTLLEHHAAQHFATLPTGQAVNLLAPHLWFDPDWQVTVPEAIAAHNRHHRDGALLRTIDALTSGHPTDPAHDRDREILEGVLLDMATASCPEEWPTDVGTLLPQLRVAHAVSGPRRVTASAHWTDSNQLVVDAVLDALPTADHPLLVRGLGGVVVDLGASLRQREQALGVALNALPAADQNVAGDLAWLVRRCATAEQWLAWIGPDQRPDL
ncbi:MAG: hypothetical protein CSA58_00655 [Micrococcales bacterium]|nr:MAG: hypothetical protein CSA58_00655 [Micrococcales bacterium]